MDPSYVACQIITKLAILGAPCSSQDIANGNFFSAYFFQNQSFCDLAPALEQAGVVKDLLCCDKKLCNAPERKTTTAEVLTPETTSPDFLKCYQGVDNTFEIVSVQPPRCLSSLYLFFSLATC